MLSELTGSLRDPWIALGFVGQALFFSRFLVQWIVAERRKEAVVPTAFWYLSIGGGVLLLTYSLHLGDPVFIAGQLVGTLVYTRNLVLIHKRVS